MIRSDQRTLRVDYLARVEGEGAMYVKIVRRQVKDVKLRIYEPPRFFEAFLRGRRHRGARHHLADLRDLPDRLPDERRAGVEDACGVAIDDGPLRDCGG